MPTSATPILLCDYAIQINMVGAVRCAVPARKAHALVCGARRLMLRSATGTAQRTVPTVAIRHVHNPFLTAPDGARKEVGVGKNSEGGCL